MEDADFFTFAVRVVHYVSFLLGLVGSVFVLQCVIFATPKTLREYSILMGAEAVADLTVTTTMFLLQPRMAPKNLMFAFLIYGPASNFSAQICTLLFAALLYALFIGVTLFPVSFAFRYYVIRRNAPTTNNVLVLCALIALICLPIPIIVLTSQTDGAVIIAYMGANAPYLTEGTSHHLVTGVDAAAHPLFLVIVGMITVPSVPIYLGVLVLRSRIIAQVDTSSLHEKTKRAHCRLIKALTFHALLPLFFIFPPTVLYILYHLELVHYREMEFIIFAAYALQSVFNPYINIFFVRAYFQEAKRFFLCQFFSRSHSTSSVSIPSRE